MRNAIIIFVVTYYYQQVGMVFPCHIKIKREGSADITTESCLFGNIDTLKFRLESREEQEVVLIEGDL